MSKDNLEAPGKKVLLMPTLCAALIAILLFVVTFSMPGSKAGKFVHECADAAKDSVPVNANSNNSCPAESQTKSNEAVSCPTSNIIDPKQFAQLVHAYVEYGLPMPPENVPLVRFPSSTRVVDQKEEKLYTLGFLLSRVRVENKNEADILVGSFLEKINSDSYPIELVNPQHLTVKDLDAGKLPFEGISDLFATAIQCYAKGYNELAQELSKLSLWAHGSYGGEGPDLVIGKRNWSMDESPNNVAEVTLVPLGSCVPLGSWENGLTGLAWNHWMSEMLRPGSDWSMIASRLESLLQTKPFLVNPPRQALLASMKAALVPSHSQPGSLDALIDKLVFVSGGWGALHLKPPEAEKVYDEITAYGFEAVPVLIRHLDDKRLTHSVIVGYLGFNNFDSLPRRVCDMVSDILQNIACEDLGQDWASRQIGNSVDKSSALKWWTKAQKEGEKGYVTWHIIKKGSDGPEVNTAQLKIIEAKYPEMLPGFYRRVTTQYRNVYSGDIVDALMRGSIPKQEKLMLFSEAINKSSADARNRAIGALIQLDRPCGEAALLRALRAMPKDGSEPYWTCPEANLSYMVGETSNPEIWSALLKAAQRARVGLRLQLMGNLVDSFCCRRHKQSKDRIPLLMEHIHFLKSFLQDSEVRKVDEKRSGSADESSKGKKPSFDPYDGPSAAFRFPVIEVRNFAAMEIGILLDFKGSDPQPNWTSDQWEKYRAQVTEACASF